MLSRDDGPRLTASHEAAPKTTYACGSEATSSKPLSVLLVTEGTYPYATGGVSNWCDLLLKGLPESRFTLLAITASPNVKEAYELPSNVERVITIPLWGIDEPSELDRALSIGRLAARKRETSELVIRRYFLPGFQALLDEILNPSDDLARVLDALVALHGYFRRWDYSTTLKHPATWRAAKAALTDGAMRGGLGAPNLYDLSEAVRLLYRLLAVLTIDIPPAHVVHGTVTGISALICVVAKLVYGVPMLLTEHGVYIRERCLALRKVSPSRFLKGFWVGLDILITRISYRCADEIAPVCAFNQRWERSLGAEPQKLRTIYNGVDPDKFKPLPSRAETPTLLWVGRVDPLKDLATLFQALAEVRRCDPSVRLVMYGVVPAGNEGYWKEVSALSDRLGLKDAVIFRGHAENLAEAYGVGDVVVLSSLSEGFPYTVIEAMMCGKPVVGTDVGGVAEAIGACGAVVEPGNPQALAAACLDLLRDPERRRLLGRRARQRALLQFSARGFALSYQQCYERLRSTWYAEQVERIPESVRRRSSHLTVGAKAESRRNSDGSDGRDGDRRLWMSRAVKVDQIETQGGRAVTLVGSDGSAFDQRPPSMTLVKTPRNGGRDGNSGNDGHGVLEAGTRDPPRGPSVQPGLSLLAEERLLTPVYALEVAAILESKGMNDGAAARNHGCRDVFELAERTLPALANCATRPDGATPDGRGGIPRRSTSALRDAFQDYVQGPIALLPLLVWGVIVTALTRETGASTQSVFALSIAIMLSLLATSGFIQAFSRKGWSFVSQDQHAAARALGYRLGALCMLAVVGVAFLLPPLVIGFAGLSWLSLLDMLGIYFSLSLLWLALSALALLEVRHYTVLCFGVGASVGYGGLRFLTALGVPADVALRVSAVTGFGSAIATTVLLAELALRRQTRSAASNLSKPHLPAIGWLSFSLRYYFLHGLLFTTLAFSSLLTGWFGSLPANVDRAGAVTGLGMFLAAAIVPYILVGGVADHALRQHFRGIKDLQRSLSVFEARSLGRRVGRQLVRHHMLLIAVLLPTSGVVYFGLVGLDMLTSHRYLELTTDSAHLSIFGMGLVGYGLLAVGALNSAFCVALSQPSLAVRGLVVSLTVALVSGSALSVAIGYEFAVLGLIGGGGTLVVASSLAVRRILRDADYYCYASF